MSHAVRIDYQGISIKCQSICEMASDQLCKLDKILDEIESGSQKLLNSQTDALREEVSKIKKNLQRKIESVIQLAKKNAEHGMIVVDSDFMGNHSNAYGVIDEARELENMVNRLSDTKIVEFESLLNQLLNNKLEDQNKKLRDLANGRIRINLDIREKINKIEDEIIKQYVYLAWIDHPNENFEQIYSIAIENKEKADKRQYEICEERKIDEVKTELRKEKINEEIIKKIITSDKSEAKERIKAIREQANAEIVSEKFRRESVKMIVQAIIKRGFIVNNDSIKIDRENNIVTIMGKKLSGAKAQFKVFLDGKFEYCFDGYKGQACQNDIKPFMKDLEEVYGIKVLKQFEIWSGNPDKISTKKYQTIKYDSKKR